MCFFVRVIGVVPDYWIEYNTEFIRHGIELLDLVRHPEVRIADTKLFDVLYGEGVALMGS